MKISKILILITLIIFSNKNLKACQCIPNKIKTIEDTERYEEIFFGEIKQIDDQSVLNKNRPSRMKIRVDIKKKWKGNSEKNIEVYQSYLCSQPIRHHKEWIFFATKNQDGDLNIGGCQPLVAQRHINYFPKMLVQLNQFFPKEIPLQKEQQGIPKILIFGFIAIAFILGLVSGKMRESKN